MTRKQTPEQAAACAAADWCTRHVCMLALDHAGLEEPARFVRELPEVKDRTGAVRAHAALRGVIDRHQPADPLRRTLVYAAIVCAHASYSEAEDTQTAAERCASAAIAAGVVDDQVRWVDGGGSASLVRSIWNLLDLD